MNKVNSFLAYQNKNLDEGFLDFFFKLLQQTDNKRYEEFQRNIYRIIDKPDSISHETQSILSNVISAMIQSKKEFVNASLECGNDLKVNQNGEMMLTLPGGFETKI